MYTGCHKPSAVEFPQLVTPWDMRHGATHNHLLRVKPSLASDQTHATVDAAKACGHGSIPEFLTKVWETHHSASHNSPFPKRVANQTRKGSL
jgi:hypothetical protein